MDIDVNEIQTSIIIAFLVTLITSLIPPFVKKVWSRRRDNNVFKVSDSNGSKTCMRHRRECTSLKSHLLQIVNFLCGGLLFGLLVLRLIPVTYRQFDSIYNITNSGNYTKSPVITEDNVILINGNIEQHLDSTSKKTLPYVELMISGFFFVVYFIEQLIQAFTGWDGWISKSSFVHLPAINSSKTSTDKHKTDNNCQTSEHSVKKECSEPSLVACYRKTIDSEIIEPKDSDLDPVSGAQQHKPDCPMAAADGNNTIGRKLRIPCRPSHPTSIIIVLPKETSEMSTTWLQLKDSLGIISSVSAHQLTNGVTIALQEGRWCWCALTVTLCYTILISVLMSMKLMKRSSDKYIIFLCQLIFASVMPFGIIITSFLKISSFSQLILMGLSSGAALHLIFMTLLQSERCTRLAGLIQYMAMYTGFTLVLCFSLLIANI